MNKRANLNFTPAVGDMPLTDLQAQLLQTAHRLGKDKFAARAPQWDDTATFPLANYADLREAGILKMCVPTAYGGLGADYATYMMTSAELGRFCGATALTLNMHISSTMWTGVLLDSMDLSADQLAEHHARRTLHFARVVNDGALYAQPFSEGTAAAAGRAPFGTSAKKSVQGGVSGWVINGKKIWASLSGAADYYGILCTEDIEGQTPNPKDTLYIAVPASSEGLTISGDWNPMGMRGTVSRNLTFQDVFVADEEQLMQRGVYYRAAQTWPAMFFTLAPTYLGIANAAYDFTVNQAPHVPHQANRRGADAHSAGEHEEHFWPRHSGGQTQSVQRRKAAPVRCPLQCDGGRQRHRPPGHSHLRRPKHDETPAAGAPVPRQPLRLADAAVDGRAAARPHGTRDFVRKRRAR
jgi:alkylation response protein AidB-like acyl-CoA dehydrogenase